MNEIIDELIIRVVYTLFMCLLIYVFKYAHLLLYPSSRTQLLKKFYPTINPADTLHFFSRIIGIGVILSVQHFNHHEGMLFAIFDFFVQSTAAFILYLASIYILESIALYNFEYIEEVVKRKNLSYGTICFAQAISLAILIRQILLISQKSLVLMFFLWLLTIVLIGFAAKNFKYYSELSFNKLVIQKSMAIALSYSGFILGCCLIINSIIFGSIGNIQKYVIFFLIKIFLSLLIFPIFRLGLIFVFQLKKGKFSDSAFITKEKSDKLLPDVGVGIYEGAIFLTCAYLTSVITGQIQFGINYPN